MNFVLSLFNQLVNNKRTIKTWRGE